MIVPPKQAGSFSRGNNATVDRTRDNGENVHDREVGVDGETVFLVFSL